MPNSDTTAWQRGVQLAFEMLLAIDTGENGDMQVEDEDRAGRPQRNVVAAYLAKLRDLDDSRCDLAFGAALTDYLNDTVDGFLPDIDRRWELFGKQFATEARL